MAFVLSIMLICGSIFGYSVLVKADDNTLPNGVITSVQLGYLDSDKNFVEYSETDEIAKDGDVVLWFGYNIPTENNLKVNTKYTFELETTNNAVSIKEGEQVEFDVYDGNTEVAICKAENSSDGKIKVAITFTDDASSYFEGSEGAFWFNASFNGDNIANTGKQSINMSSSDGGSWTQILNFGVKPVEAALNVSKAVESTEQDGDTTYIKWKITATPNLSGYQEGEDYLTEFVIEDTLPNPLNGLKVNQEKTNNANGSLVSGDKYSIEYTNEGDTVTNVTFKVNAADGNKISASEATFYVVTEYETSEVIKYLSYNQVRWENTASAVMKYPDYTKGSDGTAEPIISTLTGKNTATHTLTGVSLYKSNGTVQNDGTIKWTITATNGIGVSEPYLLDKLPDGLVLDEKQNIQINGVAISGNSYTYDNNSNELKIYLNSSRDEQTITYYTTYKDTSKEINPTLTNKVDFGCSDGVITTQYGYFTPGSAYISKTGSYDRSTHTIDWTVILTNLSMTTGTLKVSDVFGGDVGQILQTDSIKIKLGTNGPVLTVNNNGIYTASNAKVGTITIDSDSKGFVIQFSDNAFEDSGILNKIGTVVIEYTTKLNEKEIDNWINNYKSVNNTITIKADGIPSISNTGYVGVSTPVYSKQYEYGSYDYETHTSECKLTVNESRMALENPIVTDVITDTDLNWKYKTDGLIVKQGKNVLKEGTSKDGLVSGQTYYVEYVTNSNGEPSMIVYLPTISGDTVGTDDAAFAITYQATVADKASLEKLATNDRITVESNATLSGAPINSPVQVGASFPIEAGQISKNGTGMNSSNREITWNIDVNKNNAIIDGDGNKVAVCDVLQTGLLYLEDSLKVYGLKEDRGTWAESVLDSSAYKAVYDDETRKLTVTFEDDSDAANCITKAYRIVFNTRVLVSGEYTNSANFAADESTDNSNSSEKQVSGKFGGGYISLKMNGAALLLIQGKDTSDAAVSGGGFELYKEGVSTPIAELTTDGTWSNSDGKDYNAFISGLPYGSYILKRTVTPDGYVDNALEAYSINLSADYDQAIIDVLYLKDSDIENLADVIFSKEILGAGKEIAGAALKLTYEKGSNTLEAVGTKPVEGSPAVKKADDNKSVSWVSTETPLTLTYLPEGEYSLTETNAPQGYAYAETICFKIESGKVYMKKTDGTYETKPLSVSSDGECVITMEDDVVRAYFSKKAAESGDELSGAKIKLTGNNIDLSAVKLSKTSGGKDFANDGAAITWISTDTPVELTMLPDGEYTMTETEAPEGYQYANAIRFKIENGLIYLYNEETAVYQAVSTDKIVMADEAVVKTDDEKDNNEEDNNKEDNSKEDNNKEENGKEDNVEEVNNEEKDTEGSVVGTGDYIYPVMIICAVLMFLSAVVMYVAGYRKKRI